MEETGDPVEDELQAILADATRPHINPPNAAGLFTSTSADAGVPAVLALVRVRYGARIRKTVLDADTGFLRVHLLGGRTVTFNSDGWLVKDTYPGVRGVLYRWGNAVTWWLPDTVIPWRRPD